MPKLIGIAKLAAESPTLEAKKRVQYRELPARSYLARIDSPRVPFGWAINPYRGCEFGCKYCYARYTHEFMERTDFEREIFAKRFHVQHLVQELKKLAVGESIAIGTATDPYQPAERRYEVTRRMLEVFACTSGFDLGIITKSDLIVRDVELLKEVARRHRLTIAVTITTLDAALARLLEPMAPRPDLRLEAVRKLSAEGLNVRISCAPILPLINDDEAGLEKLARASAQAGAKGMWGGVVFLKPCAQAVFFPFLEERFPHLLRRYRERFEKSAYLRGAYPEMIQARIAKVRKTQGLEGSFQQAQPELWPVDLQLDLFGTQDQARRGSLE